MRNRILWTLGLAVMGTSFAFFSSAAKAQQATPTKAATAGPNLGQQGEFNGEHVDTGLAAVDSGPETGLEATEGLKGEDLEASVVKAKASSVITPMAKASALKSGQDLNVEQILDLQEIMGPDVAEMK